MGIPRDFPVSVSHLYIASVSYTLTGPLVGLKSDNNFMLIELRPVGLYSVGISNDR